MTYHSKKHIQQIIESVLEEQWGAITSNRIYGRQRNGGNVNPPEWNDSTPKVVEYRNKLRDLEPVIRQSQQYKQFLEDLGHTNPNDQSSLFGMYENFLRYFAIDKHVFQDGDNDDWTAAKAVAEYFKYHPDRLS